MTIDGRALPALIASAVVATALGTGAAAQKAAEQRRTLTGQERRESVELVKLVDEVAAGTLPGGDAWLSVSPHFFRAPDGKTYVPFTLRVQEAPEGFETIGVYVRVMKPEPIDDRSGPRRVDDLAGANVGDLPVSVPERQFVRRGTPTAGENSALLAATEAYLQRKTSRFPFEDVHFAQLERPVREDDARLIRRAVVVPAGEYDFYVAIKEVAGPRGGQPRTAVLKRSLVVPDYSRTDFMLSDVLLVDRIEPLAAPLSGREQAEHPYAFGMAELQPALDSRLQPSETLSVVLFAYNPATDAAARPNLKVDYQFYKTGLVESFFTATQPQMLSDPLAAGSDRTVVVDAAIPLTQFAVGAYRLLIRVTDQLTTRTLTRDLHFSVVDGVDPDTAAAP